MKYFLIILLFTFCYRINSIAQSPQGFNYQGVALSKNIPVKNKKIAIRFSLIQNNQSGKIVFLEIHSPTTDSFGQFSVIVGKGNTVSGNFSDIEWGNNTHYLKSEIDIEGGSNFKDVGTIQLFSVPYALYANLSGTTKSINDSLQQELTAIKFTQHGDSIFLEKNRGFFILPNTDSLKQIQARISYKTDLIKFIKDSGSNIIGGLGIGMDALKNFDSNAAINSSNIAIGYNAGASLPKFTSPNHNNDNIFVGIASGFGIGTLNGNGAGQNVMIGNYTGNFINNLAYQNVVIGHEAGRFSGGVIAGKGSAYSSNVSIGSRSLQYSKYAINNVSVGPDNFNASTDVSRNVSIGGYVATSFNGDDNILIGSEMFQNPTSKGNQNIYIGSKVSKGINGSGNIILGYKAADDSLFNSSNNTLIISNNNTKTPLIYGNFADKTLTINGDLNVVGKLTNQQSSSLFQFDSKENIFIDKTSLASNKTGYSNIALGLNALNLLDSGSNNIAIGRNTLTKMVVGGGGQGSQNIAIGLNALMNSIGNGNIALGGQSLQEATTSSWNTAVGAHALASVKTGTNNVAVGYASMIQSSESASNNVMLGRGSGEKLSGNNNVGIGNQALGSLTTGADNISIGNLAGYAINTGTNNIVIGSNAQLESPNTSNYILIGNNLTENSEIKGRLKTSGSSIAIVNINSSYSVKNSDEIILCDASGNSISVTLPSANNNIGQTFTVKRVSAGVNAVTILTSSTQKIDGYSSYILDNQFSFVKLISDGSNWFIIGK